MASKAEERRNALRATLIEKAEARIASDGLDQLRARDLAKDAGCSVGAIYNAFGDLNELAMAVNARTFQRLGSTVTASFAGKTIPPRDRLVIMSHAYLHFAEEHTLLWRALFDLKMSSDMAVPQWYLAELQAVFAHIAGPLAEIFPDWQPEKIGLMTRALFSAVHGIVLLGLEKRISAVPLDQIESMIALVLANVTSSK